MKVKIYKKIVIAHTAHTAHTTHTAYTGDTSKFVFYYYRPMFLKYSFAFSRLKKKKILKKILDTKIKIQIKNWKLKFTLILNTVFFIKNHNNITFLRSGTQKLNDVENNK